MLDNTHPTINLNDYIKNSPMYSSVLIRSNGTYFENNKTTLTLEENEKLTLRLYDSQEIMIIDSEQNITRIFDIKEVSSDLKDAIRLTNKLYNFKESSYLVKQDDSKSRIIRNMPLNLIKILCNAQFIVLSSDYEDSGISSIEVKEGIPLVVAFLKDNYVKSFVVYRANDKLKLDTEVNTNKPLFCYDFAKFDDMIEETRAEIIDSFLINKDVILGKLFCNELDKLKEEFDEFSRRVEPLVELIKNKTTIIDLYLDADNQLQIERALELEVNRPPYHLALKLNQIALQEITYIDGDTKEERTDYLIKLVAPIGTYTYDITNIEDKSILSDYIN